MDPSYHSTHARQELHNTMCWLYWIVQLLIAYALVLLHLALTVLAICSPQGLPSQKFIIDMRMHTAPLQHS